MRQNASTEPIRAIALVAVVMVGLVAAPLPALADDSPEEPRFEAYSAQRTLAPGTTSNLTVTLVNDDDDPDESVMAAEKVKATMRSGTTPFTVHSGPRPMGRISEGRPTTATFRVSVPADVDPGRYRLPIDLEYEYSYVGPSPDGNTTVTDVDEETDTVGVTVVVEDRAYFAVEEASSSVPIGESGPVRLSVRNTGTEPAHEATISVRSSTPVLRFDGANRTTRYVGDWDPGEVRNVTVDLSATPAADRRTYSLDAQVSYTDVNDTPHRSRSVTVGVRPRPEQTFGLSVRNSTLTAGEEGVVTARVVNTGPRPVRAASIRVADTGPTVVPLEPSIAVGRLGPDDATTVQFPFEVSESAEAVPRQFTFTLRYDDAQGSRQTARPLTATVRTRPDRDQFAVRPVSTRTEAGTTGTITVRVTNRGDDPVTSVNARAFGSDPLDVPDDTAFATRLAPGESTTMTFRVTAPGTALAKAYPLTVDFSYVDASGDQRLSNQHEVPVTVVEPDRTIPTTWLAGGGALGAALLVAGVWAYRRR